MGVGMDMCAVPADVKAQPVAGRGTTVTHNTAPQITITVPPGTDAQGVAEAARREVERALYEQGRDWGGMYD